MAKGKKGKKGKQGKVIPGPFDRPYLTERQIRTEARQRAVRATEPVSAIESRAARERAGAQAVTESFQDMLARQAEQNRAAQQAIQSASGGAGSALTTGAIVGSQQRAAAVPLFAAGEGVRLQRDVAQREAEARRERGETYRKNLAGFEQDIRDREREKQAARIEAAAAAKAYDIDLAKLEQRQFNEDRDYALALRREERLAAADTGDINDLVGTLDDIAKDISVKRGGGGWQGTVSFLDPETGERETLPISNVAFDPKGKTLKQRQSFWRNYVARAIGTSPDLIESVGTGSLSRGEGRTPPVNVARQLIESVMAQGYSRNEAVRAVLRTAWGGANAKAVQSAARR